MSYRDATMRPAIAREREVTTASEPLNCISLFSGAMGLDLGMERAGFDIRFASDNMPAAVETARANRPHLPFYSGDIRGLDGEEILNISGVAAGEADLVIGGPPCQSFSTAGRRLGLDDPDRGDLVFEFVRLVQELRPTAFLMENVKGLLSASTRWRPLPYNNNGKVIDELHGSLFRELTRRLSLIGYSVVVAELNAADYGVPQTRRRVFLTGWKDGSSAGFPNPTHSEVETLITQPWTTIRSAITDLRDDDSHCARFSQRKMKYLKMIPEGGNWRDLPPALQVESMGRAYFAKGGRSGYWRRLSLDRPAPTILTEPNNASTALCHPTADRPLSVRECARIQTFPDDWQFRGTGADQYRLVGNAVPVALSQRVGRHLLEALRSKNGLAATG